MSQTLPEPIAQRVLASGSLASRRRTLAGLLGQLGMVGIPAAEVTQILRMVGLPGRAEDDPDFPISLDQELAGLTLVVERLAASRQSLAGFAIQTFRDIGINHYGVLGLAMQHASGVLHSMEVMLAYPELCWGHARVRLAQRDNAVVLSFEMDAGGRRSDAEQARLREYCVTVDLVSVERLLGDVIGRSVLPTRITLPFPAPPVAEWSDAWLPCPVAFDAVAAEIHYSLNLLTAPVIHAAPMTFRRYDRIARAFSRVLAEDVGIAEQVTRLLWAYQPTPSREQVADVLGIGGRTLARRLAEAGTSWQALLRQVNSERAMNYLRHSQLPVGEIAERLGYSDPAAFTRAFQGWTGRSPSRWRAEQQR